MNTFTSKPTLTFMILSEFIWFNSNIKVDSKPVHFSFFSDKNLNFISKFFNDNGITKPWKDLKVEFHLKDTHKIFWLQIIDALPKTWKNIIIIIVGENTITATAQGLFENLFVTS